MKKRLLSLMRREGLVRPRARGVRSIRVRSRAFFLAIALPILSILGVIPASNPVHAAIGSIAEYSTPYNQTYPEYLTVGPDGNIWYTGYNFIGKVTTSGSVTQYLHSGYHYGITAGSDGNLWYAERPVSGSASIVKASSTTGSAIAQYTISHQPLNMTLGPDGNVWFTTASHTVGKITTAGIITEYSASATGSITTGPDGNLWFTIGNPGSYTNAIGKITTAGIVTTYAVTTTYSSVPTGITTGPDGNLWFTENYANKIGKITTSGVVTEYTVPTSSSGPNSITSGSDGSLWFTERNVGKVGRATTSGSITEYTVPNAVANNLDQIIEGPDGAVWFAMGTANLIGRLATQLTDQTISFTSSAPIGTTVDSSPYVPAASSTSALSVAITVDASSASVCSIDGSGNVTYQSAGTCTLDANQAGNADYNPAPQVQQSFIVLPVNADTSVALTCPATAHVGDTITCTITITNSGPADSQNATLSALFASSLTSASLSGGGTLSGQNISWSTPTLISGSSATLTLNATASVAGKAKVSAALLQTSPDPDNSNNLVTSTIIVS